MHVVLKILKYITVFLSHTLLWLILGIGLLLLAVSLHITNRDTVKSWPKDAGVYENLIDIVPDIISQSEDGEEEKSIKELLDQSGLNQDDLINAVEQVITPEFIETQTNVAIDAAFDTLEGEKDNLTFVINLKSKSTELIDALTGELIRQVKALPVCNEPQTQLIVRNGFEPFEATCKPKGVDFEKQIEQFSQDITSNADNSVGLENIKITKKDTKAFNENIELYRFGYDTAKSLPMVFFVIAGLLSVLLVVLSTSKFRGVRIVGRLYIVQGGMTAILMYLMPRLSEVAIGQAQLEGEEDVAAQEALNKVVEPLFEEILGDISDTGVKLGLSVLSIGAIMWLGVYIWHKVHHEPQHLPETKKDTPEPPIDDSAKTSKATVESEEKSTDKKPT